MADEAEAVADALRWAELMDTIDGEGTSIAAAQRRLENKDA